MQNITIYLAVGIYAIATSTVLFSRALEWFKGNIDSESGANYVPEDNSEEEKLPFEWFEWAIRGKMHPDYAEWLRRKKLSQDKSTLQPRTRMTQIRRFKSPSGC